MYNTHIIALFQIGDGGALLVEQIGGDIDRHLGMTCSVRCPSWPLLR
jgi:hypothetical protein